MYQKQQKTYWVTSQIYHTFERNCHTVTFFLKKYRFLLIWQSISSPNHIIISRHRHFNIFYQNPGAKTTWDIFFCMSHCNIFPEKKYRFSLIWQSISSPNHIIISQHRHFDIFYQNPGAKNNLRHIFFTHRWEMSIVTVWRMNLKEVIQGIERVYNCKKH